MFTVRSFTKDEFISALARDGRQKDECWNKPQVSYLFGYLSDKEVNCQTMVVEHAYVDRDYLDDFAAYYVRCFTLYDKHCVRIHFFGHPFAQADFDQLLSDGKGKLSVESLDNSYLGFTVLKPLPDAFIGRTCLEPYPAVDRRHFPATRLHVVHVAGMRFTVQGLVFQEQDTVIGACATSAVWSSLHEACALFEMAAPTPAQITGYAARFTESLNRSMPSSGLDAIEICRAIKTAGLEVEVRTDSDDGLTDLRGLLYAYGQFGLPAILGIELIDAKGKRKGFHAVTVAGYSLSKDYKPLTSGRIEKLYIHDDQAGPYCRAPFVDNATVQTQFPDSPPPINGKVFAVVIPVYPKVRITYEQALDQLTNFQWLLTSMEAKLEWDVRIAKSTDWQAHVFASTDLTAETRNGVLRKHWPRFLWLATARFNGVDVLDVVMDATDIHRSFFVKDILYYDTGFRTAIRDFLSDPNKYKDLETDGIPRAWLRLASETSGVP